MSLSTFADWIDLVLRTVVSAVVTYITTKYAITHTEKRMEQAKKILRRKR